MQQVLIQFDATTTPPPVAAPAVVTPPRPPIALVPRDYQQEAHDRTFELWQDHAGVIARLATGMGKTPFACMVIQSWLAQEPEIDQEGNPILPRVLVAIHERQLVRQFATEIRDFTGYECGIEMADQHVIPGRLPEITVASRQSLISEKEIYNPATGQVETTLRIGKFDVARYRWLLVMDECHRWAYKLRSCRPIIDHFEQNPTNRRLGITATPERTDRTSPARLFPACAIDIPHYDLSGRRNAIDLGYLVPYKQVYIQVESIDLDAIEEVGGDYSEEELGRLMESKEALSQLAVPTVEKAGDRRTLIFCPTVKVARMLAAYITEQYKDEGRRAESISGSSPDELRQDVFRRHQAGDFQFLVVCGLCREGYNDPGLECVAILRPTKSRSLAEQMKGRGCRPLRGVLHPGLKTPEERRAAIAASAKPHCLIIDLVGATGLGQTASTIHTLTQGKPDEVIEQAKKRVEQRIKEGEEFDPAEEVARAEADLERAKEELEKQRRQEQEEARRLARIKARVRYSAHEVGTGDVAPTTSRKVARMPFGKHKGQPLDQIPTGYLEYMLEKNYLQKRWLKNAVLAELDRRADAPRTPPTTRSRPASIQDINAMLLEAGH